MQGIAKNVVELLKANGADLVGFGDLSESPADVREGLPRAIAFGIALKPGVVTPIRQGPTREYHFPNMSEWIALWAN